MSDIRAVRLIFLMQPLVLGAWFPRIPQVQETIGLGEGALAVALIGMPLGLLAALSFASKIAEALGTRGLLTLGLGAYLLTMPLPAFATSWFALFLSLVFAGVAMAIAQLGLNVTATEVEARSDRLIMNGCHGYWSVGVLIGAALGSVMAEFQVHPGYSLVSLAMLCVLPLIKVARFISDYSVPAAEVSKNSSKWPSKALIRISLFGFGVATTEGAMADWLAVFMTNIHVVSPGMAGASYTVFALFIAIGRFSGDALKARIEVTRLARILVGLGLVGLTVTLFSPVVWGAYLGIALLGIGISIGFPLAVSAAGLLPGRSSAGNVAILTQISLCGFLLGPPIIGFVAEATDIRVGLAALYPALILTLALARSLDRR